MNDPLSQEDIVLMEAPERAKLVEEYGPKGAEALLDDRFTVKELRALAEGWKINLKGRDTKGDIIETIVEAIKVADEETDTQSDDEEATGGAGDAEPTAELGNGSDGVDVEALEQAVINLAANTAQTLNHHGAGLNAAVERLEAVEKGLAALQKKLKVKGSDATMHGSVDDL